MRVIGIDCGASGAIVLLEDGQPIEWTAMPTYKVGMATRVNAAALYDFIASCCATYRVFRGCNHVER